MDFMFLRGMVNKAPHGLGSGEFQEWGRNVVITKESDYPRKLEQKLGWGH